MNRMVQRMKQRKKRRARKLTDIVVEEVSLVDHPANRIPFYFLKAGSATMAEEEADETDEFEEAIDEAFRDVVDEIVDCLDLDKLQDVVDICQQLEDGELSENEASYLLSDPGHLRIRKALRELDTWADDLPQCLLDAIDSLARLSGYRYPLERAQ